MSSRVISRLSVVLGLDAQGFQREAKRTKAEVSGLEKRFGALGSSLKGVALGFAGAISVGAIQNLITGAIDYASALEEQATQLGVNVTELQEYRFAATQTGVSQDEMDASLARLTKTIGEAAAGGKSQAAAFTNLGLSIRDAGGNIKSAGVLIPEIADALKSLPDPAQRAAALVDLFGKAGQKLAPLMAEGATGIKALREEAQRLGVVLSEDEIKNADKIADDFSKLQQALKVSVSSAVLQNAGAIQALVNALIAAVAAIGKFIQARNLLQGQSEKANAAYKIIDAQNAPQSVKNAAKKRAFEIITGRESSLFSVNDATAAKPAPRRGVGGAIGGGGALALSGLDFNLILGQAEQTVDQTNVLFERLALAPPFTRQLDLTAEAFADFRTRLSEDTQSIIDDLFPEEAEQADILAKLAKLDQALAEQLITPERWLEIRGRLGIELAKVKAQIDESGVLIKPGDVDVTAIDQSVLDAGRTIKTNIGDASESAAERASRAFADLALDIEGIFGGFKRGGLSGILQGVVGIAGIAARFGAFGGGEGGAAAASTAGFAGFGGARARGGPVKLGLSYLVGERGPELFTPGASGVITANDRLRGGGGGQVTKVYDLRGAMLADAFVADVERMVAAGEARAISGGAQLAMAQNKFINDRRLG